ncbi:MAG TPA: methylmalonyl-CoA mutase [Gammaproteobacteria bacterium]|jgi:methylmalonyl-CoA mutase C-terminal domain/subunit|nr:methylmalonyl-CoA mutase [Acidiferrobacteraceae bacterium]MDP6553010.1 cobalamin-dependent protein [Arenicellales bacterium]MDP6792396.1 cobalamin-dependent protein [Arenicellales bacterium]MDP6920163.1 cobalamin-dependent protein [Arenicellales bacterium]HCX87630.1 methylmalonyl-CoA mutase [Gammaproteobacteria bacterium]|tara:strand:- start:909 stop:1337 length:429 start_codon:yes stop_codon:yes gene_type:complete
MNAQTPYRVLVTKVGLDGHDRGSRIVAAYLRDAGMEVVYTSPWQSVDQVVRLASDEDVDLIGISSLSTDHLIVPDLMQALHKAALEHVPVVVGGIVPDAEYALLFDAGVSAIFGPGTDRDTIVTQIRQLAGAARDVRENQFT